jgi:hypothetical protein
MQLLMKCLSIINKDVWSIVFKYLKDIRDFSSLALTSKWLLRMAKNDWWVVTIHRVYLIEYPNFLNWKPRNEVRLNGIGGGRLKPHYKRNEVREGVSYRQAMGSNRFYYCRRVPTIVPSPKRMNTIKTICEISYSRTSRRNGTTATLQSIP